MFSKNYDQSSSFEPILFLEIIKHLKVIWLEIVGVQFENTAVISRVKTENCNKNKQASNFSFSLY